jgi:hypothetical protein
MRIYARVVYAMKEGKGRKEGRKEGRTEVNKEGRKNR